VKLDTSGMTRVSKHAPLPGTEEARLDEICPACMGTTLVKLKPCCGSPRGTKHCPKCGYKEALK